MMNIIDQLKTLSKNEDYDAIVELRYNQNFAVFMLKKEIDAAFKKSIGKTSEEFLIEMVNTLDDLLTNPKDVKNATLLLEAIKKNQHFFMVFEDKHIQSVKEKIQLVELNRYNNLGFLNFKNIINFDFYYLLNNIEKIEGLKRLPLLKLMAKNAYKSEDFNIINKDESASFFETIFKYCPDSDIAKSLINTFIKTSIIDSHSGNIVHPFLTRELKKGLPSIIEKAEMFDGLFTKESLDKVNGYLIAHLLICEKDMTEKQVKILLRDLKDKNGMLVGLDKKELSSDINKNNFKLIMDILNEKQKTIMFIGISINKLVQQVTPQIIFPYINTVKVSDNLLGEQILMSFDTSSVSNFLKDLDGALKLSKMLDVSEEGKSRVFFSENMNIFLKYRENKTKNKEISKTWSKEKILELTNLLDNPEVKSFINDKIASTADKLENIRHVYHSGIIMQDILACAFTNFNEIANILYTNLNDEKDKMKALHSHMFRNIDLWVNEGENMINLLKDENIKMIPAAREMIMQCLRVDNGEILDKVYGNQREFYNYSSYSEMQNFDREKISRKIISVIEKEILQEKINDINLESVNTKKRRL